ncbi:hypothetical protein GCM10010174_08110 [Kutzneria viridogrisea]
MSPASRTRERPTLRPSGFRRTLAAVAEGEYETTPHRHAERPDMGRARITKIPAPAPRGQNGGLAGVHGAVFSLPQRAADRHVGHLVEWRLSRAAPVGVLTLSGTLAASIPQQGNCQAVRCANAPVRETRLDRMRYAWFSEATSPAVRHDGATGT